MATCYPKATELAHQKLGEEKVVFVALAFPESWASSCPGTDTSSGEQE